MKKLFYISLLFLSVSLFGQKTVVPQHFNYPKKTPNTFDAKSLARLDAKLEELVRNGTIPHALTFVAHHGKVIHNKAYGWRSIENKIPLQTNDYFRMASQTKAITVTAVLILFEEGKFLLDDPVKKYIPEFNNPVVLSTINNIDTTFTVRPSKRDITIRHLLTHTSGISYGTADSRKIYDKAGLPIMPLLTHENKTLGDIIKVLAKCPLDHDPGEKFSYGMSIDVLGYLVEVVSGKPIDQFFKERIFEPLGMNNTYFYLPENDTNRLVSLYQKKANSPLEKNPVEIFQTLPYAGAKTFFSTGAGLSGTIEDYAKFCQMILNEGEFNGKRILGRKTIEMIRKNAVGNLRGEIGFGLAFDDFREEYSFKSIASEGSMRWGGMFGTDYIIDPKEELILLFYINLLPNNTGTDFKVLFHNLVYQALK